MIRKYGLMQHKQDAITLQGSKREANSALPEEQHCELGNLRRLKEMSHFLEIIRNLQCRLNAKFKRPGQGLVCCEVLLHSPIVLSYLDFSFELVNLVAVFHRWMVWGH